MLKQENIDKLRNTEIKSQNLFVGKNSMPSETGETLDVVSPIDGNVFTTIANAKESDVNHAVCVVHVNCYGGADITVPFGRVKQSVSGHDRSLHALEKYTDLKTAWISL